MFCFWVVGFGVGVRVWGFLGVLFFGLVVLGLWVLGCRALGFWFRVLRLCLALVVGIWVWDFRLGVLGFGCLGFAFRVFGCSGFEFWVLGLGVGFWGSWASGFGFRVLGCCIYCISCRGLLSHSIVFDFILFQFRDLFYWIALPIGGVMVKQTSLGRHILDMGG